MIYLRANDGAESGTATIVLTLYEKCTLETPYFTFRIVQKDSKEEIIFNGLDISEYPEVYNKFVIEIVANDPIPTLGKIQAQYGEYNYYVYESPRLEELDIDECTSLVEQGILKITTDYAVIPAYSNLNNTIKVYNN